MRYLKTNKSNWRKLCKGEIQAEQLEINIKESGSEMETCNNCDECVYIGEGDYACIKEGEPKIVIVGFSTPTKDHGWCKNKN